MKVALGPREYKRDGFVFRINHPWPDGYPLPACWEWPIPRAGMDPDRRWSEFHQNRCAVCCDGPPFSRLYRDHDHHTGKIRGMLCPACNRLEGNGGSPRIARYRFASPSVLLGVHEVYRSTNRNDERIDASRRHIGPLTIDGATAALSDLYAEAPAIYERSAA